MLAIACGLVLAFTLMPIVVPLTVILLIVVVGTIVDVLMFVLHLIALPISALLGAKWFIRLRVWWTTS